MCRRRLTKRVSKSAAIATLKYNQHLRDTLPKSKWKEIQTGWVIHNHTIIRCTREYDAILHSYNYYYYRTRNNIHYQSFGVSFYKTEKEAGKALNKQLNYEIKSLRQQIKKFQAAKV